MLVTGCGLSETRDGGYAEYARVPAEAVVKLPAALSLRDAMADRHGRVSPPRWPSCSWSTTGLKPGRGRWP